MPVFWSWWDGPVFRPGPVPSNGPGYKGGERTPRWKALEAVGRLVGRGKACKFEEQHGISGFANCLKFCRESPIIFWSWGRTVGDTRKRFQRKLASKAAFRCDVPN